ncbi:MAG: class I SAM-dependent methyltransferase [Acidobacteria bacterium]|nr:class I SAM-dependent methyltransferase [Acidobacteriota bacterium]
MGLWYGGRVPEPEVMDEASEVEAYAEAGASEHLDRLDTECANAILGLNAAPDWWLDQGCGPGRITCKVAAQTSAGIVGVDRAFSMLVKARDSAARLGLARVWFVQADVSALPFKTGVFQLLCSNSVLHHLSRPKEFLEESARVMRQNGKFFLRDLARPPRWRMRRHLEYHGRNYSGPVRRLFDASVRAAYTIAEARRLVKAASLSGATVCRGGNLYLILRRVGR